MLNFSPTPLQDLCERWADITFSLLCSNVLEIAYLADVVDAHDCACFRIVAQWLFSGLNKHDNNAIAALALRTYNCSAQGMADQIKKANFPKDTVLSGLNEKTVKACRRKKVLETRKAMLSMLAEDRALPEEQEVEQEDDKSEAGHQLTVAETPRAGEGIEYYVRNEIRALEESGKYPKRWVHPADPAELLGCTSGWPT